ncbi:Crp/Fnr family transcriptional regulator [Siminovitchia sp. 179-K 8D1 HS]|uniref:Crp/Fnr family transcriptional regulator n=1 Tax=Siminovitchia sp. 179-K 8D1 HS TaxID=3142385 RepID=UPI0039A1D9D9
MMRYKWKPYLQYGQRKLKRRGETLYSQGQKGKGFFYLAKGKVSIRLLSEDGKERIIDYVLEGYLFGEQGVSSDPYSTTAIADTDVTLCHFTNEALMNVCRENPEAKELFISSLISKVRLLSDTYAMLNKPYEQQMAHFLIRLREKHDSRAIPITQVALAQYIGTSRITIYKILQKWIKENMIIQKSRMIEVTDLHKLKALLD